MTVCTVPSVLHEFQIHPKKSLKGIGRRRKDSTDAGATSPASRTEECSEIQLDPPHDQPF